MQNGSLTRRPLTSDDKLLQQLLGKKAAKAHIAARQAPKENNNTQKPALGPRNAQPEESDEEEDGRASTFKSKRRKICQTNATGNIEECSDDPKKISDLERRGNADECGLQASSEKQLPKDDHDHDEDPSPQSRRKPKSASYLDEILAERSKRKKKKAKNKSETAT